MNMTLKTLATSLLMSAIAMPAIAQDILIKDANIVTNTSQGTIERGDILVQGGNITRIAEDLQAVSGVEIMDGTDHWVTPGLFVPFSQLGQVEISLESSANDSRAREAKTSVSNRAVDSFNPKSVVIGNSRVDGITHFVSVPGTGKNIFGGTGFVATTSGDFDSVINPNAFIYVELGVGGARSAGGSRAAALSQFRAALSDASAYPARYDGPQDGDALSRQDAAALFAAARGNMPFLIKADRASDLLTIIELKNDYNIDVIVVGAAEGWMVADQLAAAKVKVMVDPQENLPDNFDMVGARADNILMLDEAGVEYAIMTRSADTSHNVRVISQHAGNAVGNGLSWDKAFAAVSATPSKWFGSDAGTLSVGKKASFVVWNGDPLEVTTAAKKVYIAGENQELVSRQTLLRDRYNPTTGDTRRHKYRN